MSVRALWIESRPSRPPVQVADIEAVLSAFGGVDRAFLLGGDRDAYRILLVEPEQGASEDLALHMAARLSRDIVRVATRWASVSLARFTAEGPAARFVWPPPSAAGGETGDVVVNDLARVVEAERAEEGPSLLGPYLLFEEVIEAAARRARVDVGLASIGVRAIKDLTETTPPAPIAVVQLELPPAPSPLASAVGPGAKSFLAALSRKSRVSVLAVLDDEAPDPDLASLREEAPDGFRMRAYSRTPRHGAGAAVHVAASASLVGLTDDEAAARVENAKALLERWASAWPIAQGLVAVADWDPTLQIDLTPWEAAWDAAPVAERPPGWMRAALRGFGEALVIGPALERRLGGSVPGRGARDLHRRGPVLDIGATPLAQVEAWLTPLFPTSRLRPAPEALPRGSGPEPPERAS